MKKIITLVMFAIVSFAAAAQVEICQLATDGTITVNGATPPKGTVLASVNKQKLRGGTCEAWRVEKAKEFTTQKCVLLADGKLIFEGYGDKPPARQTVIASGVPKPGQSCDQWREEQASILVNG